MASRTFKRAMVGAGRAVSDLSLLALQNSMEEKRQQRLATFKGDLDTTARKETQTFNREKYQAEIASREKIARMPSRSGVKPTFKTLTNADFSEDLYRFTGDVAERFVNGEWVPAKSSPVIDPKAAREQAVKVANDAASWLSTDESDFGKGRTEEMYADAVFEAITTGQAIPSPKGQWGRGPSMVGGKSPVASLWGGDTGGAPGLPSPTTEPSKALPPIRTTAGGRPRSIKAIEVEQRDRKMDALNAELEDTPSADILNRLNNMMTSGKIKSRGRFGQEYQDILNAPEDELDRRVLERRRWQRGVKYPELQMLDILIDRLPTLRGGGYGRR